MSFLTPLYLLAGLAVTLPILFHLIRRTPKGRQVFSSLMFLEPSPPKLTKRSRLENWLLLLLRALAICLIAAAFSRPFLRSQIETESGESSGRRLAILIDKSASMQHADHWDQAVNTASDLLDEVTPADAVSVMTFDREIQTIIGFEDWAELTPDARKSTVMEKLAEIEPSNFATELGTAVITTADLLNQKTERQVIDRRLFVISDFQEGCRWEPLNGYEWPENVHVEVRRLEAPSDSTNASIHLVGNESLTEDRINLRISNAEQSRNEVFRLGWIDQFSEVDEATGKAIPTDTMKLYAPPGQSKVFKAPERSSELVSERVVLTGDKVEFDNTCYVAVRRPWDVQIVFLGEESASGADSLRFFLDPVFPDTPGRKVTITEWETSSSTPPIEDEKISLAVVGGSCTQEQLVWAKEWVTQGGQLLFVATDENQAMQLYDILDSAPTPVEEGDVDDYLMLGSVDLSHPVFAPFDDPRFADFSKLRFYEYREFDLESLPEKRVLASFEGGLPAITEIPVEEGRVVLFSSGWRRQESDFAVWSKFVPLMNGLLEYIGNRADNRLQFYVGDSATSDELGFPDRDLWIKLGDQDSVKLASGDSHLFDAPGIYSIADDEKELSNPDVGRVSVNLHPSESRTTPLDLENLIAAGLPIEKKSTEIDEEEVDAAISGRQLMNRELEARQQIWRWLLLAALGVLLLETIIAGIQQRPRVATTQQLNPSNSATTA